MSFSLFVNGKTDSIIIESSDPTFQSSSHEALSQMLDCVSFSVKEADRGFLFEIQDGEAQLEDEIIKANSPTALPSGRELKIGTLTIIASINSTRAEVSGKEDVKSWSARSLIALIILFEVLFITVLPSTFTGEENFKREYLLEEISEELDVLRGRVQSDLKGHGKKSSMKSGILKDIKESLDGIANDLRLNPKAFSLTDLESTSQNLVAYNKLLNRLSYSPVVNEGNISINKQALLDQAFTE